MNTPSTALSAEPQSAGGGRNSGVLGLHHVALLSRDAARAADFYPRVLGLRELGSGTAPSVAYGVVDEMLPVPARVLAMATQAPDGQPVVAAADGMAIDHEDTRATGSDGVGQ